MKEKKQEELQSRREFFKSAAKAALPVLGAVVLGSLPRKVFSQSSSYRPYVDAIPSAVWNGPSSISSCQVCSGSCSGTCHGTCMGSCMAYCKQNCDNNGCTNTCSGACRGGCSGSCYNTCKWNATY